MRVSSNHFSVYCLLFSLGLAGCTENIQQTAITETQQSPPVNTVSELSLKDFFKLPVGARGLEPSAKLLSLNHKRVHISGYRVKEEEPTAGLFMLAPLPVNMAEKEDGPADDMPPATLFVHLPVNEQNTVVPYRTGLWQLTGTLELGNKEETNGRVSYARLILD